MNNYDWQQIKHKTDGQWQSILSSLAGIDSSFLRNKNGPCPACGGVDRFRFDDKNGTGSYFCNGCGAGDGISLLEKCSSFSFYECVQEIGKFLMIEPSERTHSSVPRKKIAKVTSTRKKDFIDKERANDWIEDSLLENITAFSARNRIKTALYTDQDGFSLWLIERGLEPVNCYATSENNQVQKYIAGGMTNGGYHRINKETGKSIFFCVNIIDSHLTAQFTNCECVCAFEFHNLLDAIDQYKSDYKPDKPIYIAANNNINDLSLAEKAGLKVILPVDSDNIDTSSGFHKKLFDSSEILDK